MIGNNFYNIGYDSNHYKQKKTGQSFEPEYIAILDRATALGYTKPTIDQQIKQNVLLKNMKNNNSFALNDLILVFANNGSKEFACINWKNPNGNLATLVNGPTFTSNIGFTGNGTSSYILSGYIPSGSLNYTLNNASRMIYVKTSAVNKVLDGIAGSTANSITTFNSSLQRINQAGNNLLVSIDYSGVGLMSIHRNNTNVICITNTTQTSSIRNSTSISPSEQGILASAWGTGSAGYGAHQISLYTMGANLTSQNNQIKIDFEAYLNSL